MINLPKVALTIPKGIKIGAPTEEIRMVWKVTLGMKHPVDVLISRLQISSDR